MAADRRSPDAATTPELEVYEVTIVISFQHENPEDAERVGERMLDRALEHPSAIEGTWTVSRA